MLESKVSGAILRAYENHLEIEKTGIFGGIGSDSRIEYSDIAEIGHKPANHAVNGFIHIATYKPDGSYFTVHKMSDMFKDDIRNYFNYPVRHAKTLVPLIDYINNWLKENGSGPASKSAGKVDTATQLKALKDLLNAGLISQEDFDKQTAGLN